MKKSILALAILGAISGAATAQSSVTVFGAVDVGVRSVTNDGTTLRSMSTSGYSPSAIGFRGVEDLGDGLSASFWLEGQTSVDTGTTESKFFGRRATLGLTGRFGEVRLGRDLNPSYLNLGTFDAFGNLGIGSNLNLLAPANPLGSGVSTLVRTDNSISYFTPAMGGFYAHVMGAPGEGTPGNQYKAVRIGYADSKLNVAAAVGVTNTATDNFTLTNLGASYDFGVAKVMGIYNVSEFGAKKSTMIGVGANAPIGDFWQLRVSAARANATGAGTDANDANLFAVGGIYLLSKRTALYGTASRIANNNAAAYSIGGAFPSATNLNRSSTGFEFGVRHGF